MFSCAALAAVLQLKVRSDHVENGLSRVQGVVFGHRRHAVRTPDATGQFAKARRPCPPLSPQPAHTDSDITDGRLRRNG